ncbi:DUF1801 domain-containing protein [Thalassotalea agarivorans]|uniref:YdhG-like domain-containing protein n=1 Tax=Thalassotalea agarivorans TaxID=349064 RepID=A0A1I0BRP8_THASX|nr:DUF1801 domain-containing protein [Thalassotalea agarivorans]SET09624.1 protein of unknown function (DU1801) [Thalassotalea agarivorans]
MSALKTQQNNGDVLAFINQAQPAQRQSDALKLLPIMEKISGQKATMWGTSIVGFGQYHYTNTGKGGSWPITGFSPRKNALTIYVMPGFERYKPMMDKLGKYTTGKSCLYVKKLNDINLEVLTQLLKTAYKDMQAMYETD